MISILTVTKRDGWQGPAVRSLQRNFMSLGKKKGHPAFYEWVIVAEDTGTKNMKWLQEEALVPIPFTILQAPPKKEGNFSNLSSSNNAGLKMCVGEYVVFYQDFIELEPDCLEKLVALATPTTFVTTLTRNPEGELEDGRYTWQDEVRTCWPEEWEENVGLAPMAILRELGGYDEEYDQGWAWNNCNVAERAEMLGCNFLLDETNRPQLLYHKKEPELNPDMPLNRELHLQRMKDIRDGKFPIRLNYL